MASDIVAVFFLSREVAHREHLMTESFAQHMALGTFYEDIIGIADRLAEASQGYSGKRFTDIPFYSSPMKGDVVKRFQKLLERVQELRKDCYPESTCIQNIIDEAEAIYLSLIYKLTFLK